MRNRLLLWLAAYGALSVLKYKLGYAPLADAGIKFEGAAAGGMLLAAMALPRGGPWFPFAWSLAMSRVMSPVLSFLCSPWGRKLLHAFKAGPLVLAPWQKMAIPPALGLGFMALMSLKLGWRQQGYSGSKFLKDAERAARGAGTFILGKSGGKRVVVSAQERGKHLQIVGPTGSGKTQLILGLTYQDMLRGMPVFLMEAKGDKGDFQTFLKLAKKAGRLKDVVHFNPDGGQSMSFNPIRPVGRVRDPIAIANQLSRAIGREPGGDTDGEHYRSLDFARFVDLAEILVHVGGEFTLEDVYGYFASEDVRHRLFQQCRNKALVAAAEEGLTGQRGDVASIKAHLRPWVSGNLGQLLNQSRPDVTLESVFEQKKLAYFSIPVGYMPLQTNALGRMIISSVLAYAQVRQNGGDRRPASLYLDEFPEFVTPGFSTLISTMRSAGLWACLSHQDLGQLKRIEGMDKEAFTANVFANTAGAKVFFKMTSADDAEKISKLMGTHPAKAKTRQIKRGMFFDMATGYGTEGERESFNVHPNELKRLPSFRAVTLTGDGRPETVSTPRLYEGLEGETVAWSSRREAVDVSGITAGHNMSGLQ